MLQPVNLLSGRQSGTVSQYSEAARNLQVSNVPNPQPGPARPAFQDSVMTTVQNLRDQINFAGRRHNVAPEVIGAILYDELKHRSAEDDRQDQLAVEITKTEPNTVERTNAIADANNDWGVNNPVSRLVSGSKDIASSTTIGQSQLSVDGVKKLVNSENNKNYLKEIISAQDFNRDPVGKSLKL